MMIRTYLCSSEHHTIQKDSQLLESSLAWSYHATFLDGRQNFIVPETRLKNEKSDMYIIRQRNNIPHAAWDCDHILRSKDSDRDKGRATDIGYILSQFFLSENFQWRDLHSHFLPAR